MRQGPGKGTEILLGPGAPAQGMLSSPDPSVLPPGYWSLLQNVRVRQGILRVRDGAALRSYTREIESVGSTVPYDFRFTAATSTGDFGGGFDWVDSVTAAASPSFTDILTANTAYTYTYNSNSGLRLTGVSWIGGAPSGGSVVGLEIRGRCGWFPPSGSPGTLPDPPYGLVMRLDIDGASGNLPSTPISLASSNEIGDYVYGSPMDLWSGTSLSLSDFDSGFGVAFHPTYVGGSTFEFRAEYFYGRVYVSGSMSFSVENHGFQSGDAVRLSGLSNELDGDYVVTTVDSHTFTLNGISGDIPDEIGRATVTLLPALNAEFRGAWHGRLNGVDCCYAGFRVDGETRIYQLIPSLKWSDLSQQTSLSLDTIQSALPGTPITIAYPSHGLETGEEVVITGVTAVPAANGKWKVTRESADTFKLIGSSGTGSTGAGGRWRRNGAFSTDAFLSFAPVRDTTSIGEGDLLIIGNGEDNCRVVGTLSSDLVTFPIGPSVGIVPSSLAAPEKGYVSVGPKSFFPMSTQQGIYGFDSVSGATFVISAGGPGRLVASAGPPLTNTICYLAYPYANSLIGNRDKTWGLDVTSQIAFFCQDWGDDTFWSYVNRIDAMVQGNEVATITNATNDDPIVITTAAAHGLVDEDYVFIAGVVGNDAANGFRKVSVIDSTSFSLIITEGSGSYLSGGKVYEIDYVTIQKDSDPDLPSPTDLEIATPKAMGTGWLSSAFTAIAGERRTFVRIWDCSALAPMLVGGFRFFYTQSVPDEMVNTDILAIVATGGARSDSIYAASYIDGASRSESPAAALPAKPMDTASFGVSARWGKVAYPTSYTLNSLNQIMWPASGRSDLWTLVYRSDAATDSTSGQTVYGPYNYVGYDNETTPFVLGFYRFTDNGLSADPTSTAPDEFHRTIPKAGQLLSANDRLFAGTISGADSELWISEDRRPFRFRKVVRSDDQGNLDPTSGTFCSFTGQKVTAMARIQGTILGRNPVVIFTDRAAFRLEGDQNMVLCMRTPFDTRGTFSPRTVAAHNTAIWFLDNEGQVRRIEGGVSSEPLSVSRVDNRLAGGDLRAACAYAGNDRYEIFYGGVDPDGDGSLDALNQEGLIYDGATQQWVMDRFQALDVAGVVLDDSSLRRPFAFTHDGLVWELEARGQETEGGNPLSVRLEGREISDGLWNQVMFSEIGVVMDAGVNAEVETTRYFPREGTSVTGRIDLSDDLTPTLQAWRWDRKDNGRPAGGASVSCIPKLSASLPGGRRIRSVRMNFEARPGGPDAK